MTKWDKYIYTAMRLEQRYYDKERKCLVVEIGGKPTKVRMLQDMAFQKYLNSK